MKTRHISDYIIDGVIFLFMIIVLVGVIYPFVNAGAISLNDADDTARGGITFYPRIFTLKNYQLIFKNSAIMRAYFITISRTVVGTITGLFFTGLLSFALAHRNLAGRKFYTMMCLIPMYFSGGLIPIYFVIKWLGLVNTFWVYIIPLIINLWNMILMRTYFQGIPTALEESARMDGSLLLYRIFQDYYAHFHPHNGDHSPLYWGISLEFMVRCGYLCNPAGVEAHAVHSDLCYFRSQICRENCRDSGRNSCS
jgi:putative aldouronate transport system permease protein